MLALAVALFAAMLALRASFGSPDEPGAVVFAPSVALVALELGALPGVGAAVVATVAFWATFREVSEWDLAFRAAALIALGALVGALGSRLRAARAVVHTAAGINDNVVQALVLAKYAVARGDVAEASARIDETLDQARQIVEGLLGPGRVRGGELRREAPAKVR